MTSIAILADSHDNIWNLDKALAAVNAAGADVLLHLGDLVVSFIVAQIAEAFAGPIHIIEGNNGGDGRLQQVIASIFAHVTLHGPYAELAIGGCKIALTHYPEPAKRIAQSGQFDLVCYGHNHLQNWEQIGTCQLVNSGEVMGRYGAPSWGLYDRDSGIYKLQSIG